MENLFTDLLESRIGGNFLKKTGKTLNTDSKKTKSVVDQALPFLLGALAKNTSTNQGANSLSNALKKDHDGSIFNNLDQLISSPENSVGSNILKHVFAGNSRSEAETYISRKNGINTKEVGKMFQILAPIVMGGLGKMQKEKKINPEQLAGILKIAAKKLDKNSILALVAKFIDKNGDGDIKDDLLTMSKSWIFRKFRK